MFLLRFRIKDLEKRMNLRYCRIFERFQGHVEGHFSQFWTTQQGITGAAHEAWR